VILSIEGPERALQLKTLTRGDIVDKYKNGAKRKFKPKMDQQTGEYKTNPFIDSQESLTRAMFAKKERDEFFTEAYSDILVDLFVQWLQTEPHCTKEREYLFHVAMGLGSVKERLIQVETYGFNQEILDHNRSQEGDK
jgi:hypothetical protein